MIRPRIKMGEAYETKRLDGGAVIERREGFGGMFYLLRDKEVSTTISLTRLAAEQLRHFLDTGDQ